MFNRAAVTAANKLTGVRFQACQFIRTAMRATQWNVLPVVGGSKLCFGDLPTGTLGWAGVLSDPFFLPKAEKKVKFL